MLSSASAVSILSAASAGNAAATTSLGASALFGDLLLIIGGILSLVAWIGTLIATAKQGRWGWFVCTIIFSYITELIYLIAGSGL